MNFSCKYIKYFFISIYISCFFSNFGGKIIGMAKKLCFLVDSIFSIGGVQRVTSVIAKALSNTYEVTIVTLDAPSAYDTTLYGLD